MLKNLRFLLTMLCLAVFSGMWAEEVTFNWSQVTKTQTKLTTANTYTAAPITLVFDKGSSKYFPTENKEGSIRMYKNTVLKISAAEGYVITKVVFTPTEKTYSATNLTFNGTALPSDSWGLSNPAQAIELTAAANPRFKKIVVTYAAAGGNIIGVPTINGQETFLNQQTITITGPENSTIYYGIDLGENFSTAEGEYSGKGNSPLEVTIDKTCTIQAIAKVDDKISEIASRTFIRREPVDKTIADLHGMTEDQAFINLRLTNAKVVYVDTKNVYVREGNKAVFFFVTGLNLPLNSTLNGSLVCDYDYQYGVIKVKDNSYTNLDHVTVTEATTTNLDPTVTTIEDVLQHKNVSDLVRLNGVSITKEGEGAKAKYYAASGETKVQLYSNNAVVKDIAGDGNTYDLIAGFNNILKGVAGVKPFTVAIPVTVGETRYTTLYYSKLALTIPEGATASTYKVADGKLETSKSYGSGKHISMGTAVVINAEPGNYEFLSTTSKGNSDSANMLSGTDTETMPEADANSYFYCLSTNNAGEIGSVGFYWGTEDGSAFTNGAHKAYLKVGKDVAGGAKAYLLSGGTTGIDTLKTTEKTGSEAIYNLAGQQVDDNYKGVVIVNGKKVIKR